MVRFNLNKQDTTMFHCILIKLSNEVANLLYKMRVIMKVLILVQSVYDFDEINILKSL